MSSIAREAWPRLEMDRQASMARMSLVMGQDFWHEKPEERCRIAALEAITELGRAICSPVHSQRQMNTVTRAFNDVEESQWAA